MNQAITLYYFDSCPFCIRVLNYISENDINISKKNILENDSYREELMKLGGKTQVPALKIDNDILYESNDIIGWLDKNA